jgi:hypothetical protein
MFDEHAMEVLGAVPSLAAACVRTEQGMSKKSWVARDMK